VNGAADFLSLKQGDAGLGVLAGVTHGHSSSFGYRRGAGDGCKDWIINRSGNPAEKAVISRLA